MQHHVLREETRGCRVFISYSSEDRDAADLITKMLEKRKITCIIAPRDLPAGHWPKAIAEAIDSCRLLLIVFSPAADASRDVCNEIGLAHEYKRSLLPVRICDCEPSKNTEYFLRSVQWFDEFVCRGGQKVEDLNDLDSRADALAEMVQSAPSGETVVVGTGLPSVPPSLKARLLDLLRPHRRAALQITFLAMVFTLLVSIVVSFTPVGFKLSKPKDRWELLLLFVVVWCGIALARPIVLKLLPGHKK